MIPFKTAIINIEENFILIAVPNRTINSNATENHFYLRIPNGSHDHHSPSFSRIVETKSKFRRRILYG